MTKFKLPKILITKSKYTLARTRDYLALWLSENKSQVAGREDKMALILMEQGREVEKDAYKHPKFRNNQYKVSSIQNEKALEETEKAILAGHENIFQATFYYENILIKVDILHKNEEGNWELYEVKTSTNESKKRKEFVPDLAIQKWVLFNCLDNFSSSNLITMNGDYRFKEEDKKNEEERIQNLFKIIPYDSIIQEEFEKIQDYVDDIIDMLSKNVPPLHTIGSVCKSPDCRFKSYCWKSINDNPMSVETLTRINDKKRINFRDQGIQSIDEIKDQKIFGTSERQKLQWACAVNKKPYINIEEIKSFNESLKFPLYFFDVETYMQAIPKFKGSKPLEQIVFQASLHVVRSEEEFANPEHYEFLYKKTDDPRPHLLSFLQNHIKNDGSIVVYHQSFEKSILTGLKNYLPESDTYIDELIDTFVDLENPFKKTHLYFNEFKGSSSIKEVFSLLEKNLSYKDLDINNGAEAQYRYYQFVKGLIQEEKELEDLFTALFEYCKLDTLAMVKICIYLKNIVNSNLEDFLKVEDVAHLLKKKK